MFTIVKADKIMKDMNEKSYAITLLFSGFNCNPLETIFSKAYFCKHCLSSNVSMVSQQTWELRDERNCLC